MWINRNEILNNNIDDDNNGYADDINGYDFEKNSGKIIQSKTGNPIAGIISALRNNRIGVAGIARGTGSRDGMRLRRWVIFLSGDEGSINLPHYPAYYDKVIAVAGTNARDAQYTYLILEAG